MRRIAERLTAAGATVVDGSISGAPPNHEQMPRIYLSGPEPAASRLRELFTAAGFVSTVVGTDVGSASALKMILGSYLRSSRMLAALAHAAADEYGLTDQLVAEARNLGRGDLADRDAIAGVAARAWRWTGELRDIAATLAAAGVPTGLADASADLYQLLLPARDNFAITSEAAIALLTGESTLTQN
jgi:3-hydroxyisobutyrate dehydrogenase-like beta-hydroxyacid dehydrogenase